MMRKLKEMWDGYMPPAPKPKQTTPAAAPVQPASVAPASGTPAAQAPEARSAENTSGSSIAVLPAMKIKKRGPQAPA